MPLEYDVMKVLVAADHAGLELKDAIKATLKQDGHQVMDLGAQTYDPHDDYPDFAEAAGRAIAAGEAARGILLCGSGVGASIAANKLSGVRAAVCHDTYSARQGVEHDDMNLLVLGSRVVGEALAKELVSVFLRAEFSGEERHMRRLEKVRALERKSSCAQRAST